jgi:hypothetical protein
MEMPRFRFSLAAILGMLVVVALALAGLVSIREVWSKVLFSAMVFALFISILGISYRQDDARAFCVGFAVLGWGHMLIASGPWFENRFSRNLVTTSMAQYLHPKLQRAHQQTTSPPAGNMSMAAGAGLVPAATLGASPMTGPSEASVWRTCHSIFTLLLAWIGGGVARYFWGVSRRVTNA